MILKLGGHQLRLLALNQLCQYYSYCNSTYTFYAKEDVPCGTIIHLADNQYSGLDSYVLVTEKTSSSKTGVIEYVAIGISVFNLDKGSFHRSTSSAVPDLKGKDGIGISSIDYFYKTTSVQLQPQADTITETEIPILSPTSKYLWQKEVISYSDGSSKTSVFLIGVYGDSAVQSKYLGKVTEETFEQVTEDVAIGDSILAAEDFTIGDFSFISGYPYLYDGTGWILQTKISNDNASMLWAMVEDAKDLPGGAFSWFTALVSDSASIRKVFSQSIVMSSSGTIRSENYSESDRTGYLIQSADGSIKAYSLQAFGNSELRGGVRTKIKVFSHLYSSNEYTTSFTSSPISLTAAAT